MLRLITLSLLIVAAPALAGLGQGDTVPPTRLLSATGKKIEITSYAKSEKKRNLLLVFFRTGTCSVCTAQLIEFAGHYDQILANNATVLAVSLDDAIVHVRTGEKIENKFPLLLDPDAKTVNQFGVFNPEDKLSRPSLFLVGPDRKILYSYIGQNLRDRPTWETVLDVLKHYSGLTPTRAVSGKTERQ